MAQSSIKRQYQPMTIRDYLRNPIANASQRLAKTYQPESPQTKKSTSMGANAPSRNPPFADAYGSISNQAMEANVSPITERGVIQNSIHKAAEKYNLPSALINAVIKAESNYQPTAVSPVGAQGLMQLMPGTAAELGVSDPFDIDQNIDAGARYLRDMLTRFDGDTRLALSAYNAGPGTVVKYNGNVPYAETQNYVDRVMRYERAFSDESLRYT
jgi:soluble lytic murein transglycosylase-like protein